LAINLQGKTYGAAQSGITLFEIHVLGNATDVGKKTGLLGALFVLTALQYQGDRVLHGGEVAAEGLFDFGGDHGTAPDFVDGGQQSAVSGQRSANT
jgi:hypothetical protein